MTTSARKKTFKTPPTAESQQLRRQKALEEQKKKRLQKVDASRQLDILSDLTLAGSDPEDESPTTTHRSGKPSTSKPKNRNTKSKKWADKCMYAELLEMRDPFGATPLAPGLPNGIPDGLPDDLEADWIALAPVPVGKRCLAVTHNVAIGVTAPTTMLRSRVLGKSLLPPFLSALPANTVLDCILDERWKENGIVHVLDVLRWKGQDISECEASFRFWWRDTRLSELAPFPPHFKPGDSNANNTSKPHPEFLNPNLFTPVPFITPTCYEDYTDTIIPLARCPRTLSVLLPGVSVSQQPVEEEDEMQLDTPASTITSAQTQTRLVQSTVQIHPDGLLLYLAQASYENGTSPLSSWIPIVDPRSASTNNTQIHLIANAQIHPSTRINASTQIQANANVNAHTHAHPLADRDKDKDGEKASLGLGDRGPLDVFERLVRNRIQLRHGLGHNHGLGLGHGHGIGLGPGPGPGHAGTPEISMSL